MASDPAAKDPPGVYGTDADGRTVLVHSYQGGNYRLSEIIDIFQLGRLQPVAGQDRPALVLNRAELRTLKTMADAFSFDYDESFIEMCHEMHRFAHRLPGEEQVFVANF
jgi:hypothetical protein